MVRASASASSRLPSRQGAACPPGTPVIHPQQGNGNWSHADPRQAARQLGERARGLHPRAGSHQRAHAVHLPAHRPDAGRPPRARRHGRFGHPDARRRDAGRRRRRHRLRHDRGPYAVRPERPRARAATSPALRAQIERAVPLSAGQNNAKIVATAAPRVAELEALAAEAGFDACQVREAWRQQLGTLGSGNHFIEVSVDEAGRRVDLPPLRQPGRRQQDRAGAHQGRAGADDEVVDRAAGPRPRLPGRGHGRVRPVHRRAAVGAAVRAAQPRGDDGPRRAPALRAPRRGRRGAGADQLPPQLHAGGAALRQDRVGLPEGCDLGATGRGRADPRFDGHRLVRGRGAREPDGARLLAARCGPGLLPVGRAADVHARAAAGGDGRASSSGTPTRSSTRSRRPTSRSSRSWPTPPTSCGSGTRCGSSST